MSVEVPSLVLDLPEAEYHADPVEGGSLSYSGMKQLLKSPAHYRHYMDAPRVEKKVFDEGTIIHSLVLGTPLNVVELPYSDYRSKDARAARDEAYAAGLIPVKPGELDPLTTIAEAVLAYPEARALFETDLPAEVSLFAPDPVTGVTIRGRVDKVAQVDGNTVLVDLKTCQDADPAEFRKNIAQFGYYLQSAVYTRLWSWTHEDTPPPEMRFVAVSKTAPHLVSVHRMGLEFDELGEIQMRRAIDRYKTGVETGEWPGYLPIVWEQSPPAWLLAAEESEELEIIL